jgi:hypothetical protein
MHVYAFYLEYLAALQALGTKYMYALQTIDALLHELLAFGLLRGHSHFP